MRTALLDQSLWDLCLDANGNWAVADDPYSIAQDIASALRLFSGELWYDTTKGVPYFNQILGRFPPAALLKAQFVKAALTVPGVTAATCTFSSFAARALSGTLVATTAAGNITVGFAGTDSALVTSVG